MGKIFLKAVFIIIGFLSPKWLGARTYIADTPEEIQSFTDQLQPGDTLLVMPGVYNMNWRIRNRHGLPSDWIVIIGEPGAVIRGIPNNNVIDFGKNSYVEIKGFEITGGAGHGIRFYDTCSYILMENLHIHNVPSNGISATLWNLRFSYFTIRRCRIHDARIGMYLGDHQGRTPVHNCVIERNWIYNMASFGIQIKRQSYLNVVQDNVLYRCAYEGARAAIAFYRTDRATADSNNIVRRNAIWDSYQGIFVGAQTTVENNVIFNCYYGINNRNYNNWGISDIYIRNNTIYQQNTGDCIVLQNWDVATGDMVMVNNACYQNEESMSAIRTTHGIGSGIMRNNRYYGRVYNVPPDGATLGNPPAVEFLVASLQPGVVNLYPRNNSTLIDAGTSAYGVPNEDFNPSPRPFNHLWDVGAYEWSGNNNPGWQIQEGFKEMLGVIEDNTIKSRASNISVLFNNGVFHWKNLPQQGNIIRIYDITGRLIHRSARINGGEYKWYPYNVPKGIYFYLIENEGQVEKGKIILWR